MVVDLGIAVVIVVNLGNVVTLVGLEVEGNVVEAGSVVMSSLAVYCAAVDKKKLISSTSLDFRVYNYLTS